MRTVSCLLGLALAAGPARGALPPQESASSAARAGDLAAIDPLVAGLLVRGCAAIDDGLAPSEGVVEDLLERPLLLHAALCSVLEHGSWRAPVPGESGWVEHRLRERHRPWLRSLAARLSPTEVLRAAQADLEAAAAPARLRARLVLAGEVARARDVRLLGELAVAAGVRVAAEDYELALLASLRRHDGTCRELDAAWSGLAPALRLPALDALAACARPAAVSVIGARLDDQPELRAAVLARLGALAERLEEPPDARVTVGVRALLDAPQTMLRREAALCVGRLQDAESAPRLVEMLASRDRAERDAALWALRRISRLGFTADPRPWRLWLEEESAWWNERAAACLRELNDRGSDVALAALDEVARRRLHRDVLAAAVADMGGATGDLAERRCHVLRALGSRAGLAFLRECLEQPDEGLRGAAEGAWRASTQLPVPLGPYAGSQPR